MRCGVLIIGSLLWDDGKGGIRAAWRAARLDVGAHVPVRASIRYGRKSTSRSNTYTMVFGPVVQTSQAVLVPCAARINTIHNLITEASALWQAENANAKPGVLHKSWGCVGAVWTKQDAREAVRRVDESFSEDEGSVHFGRQCERAS